MIAPLPHATNGPLTPSVVLPQFLKASAERHPERLFVTDVEGSRLTYGQLHDRALLWAGALEALGVGKGDPIAILAPNSAETLALWLGAAWLGAIEIAINTEYRGRMLVHALNTCRARVGIASTDQVPALAGVSGSLECLEVIAVLDDALGLDAGGLKLVGAPGLLASAKLRQDRTPPAAHDIACAMYTSGTTGVSKCVLMPWAQLYASATGTMPPADLGSEDCLYIHGPNYHIGGKALPYLMALVGGRVGIRPRFSLSQFWPDVARFQATVTTLGAATTKWVSESISDPIEPRTLRGVMMAPLTRFSAEFAERFGVQTYTCYSMTELSMPLVGECWGQANWQSCGRLRPGWPGYEVRIVDEHDYEVPMGSLGELIVRTGAPWTLTAGYLNAPDRTAEAWRNGWFHTGDGFRRDPEGNYYFVDRLKDAIRRRGENISSQEVEAEVLAHSAVLECAAVAIPADAGEDEIKLVVVPQPGQQLEADELIRFLIPRVARFMVPRYVEIVDSLPRTETQKVQKSVLRDRGIGPWVWDREAAGMELPR